MCKMILLLPEYFQKVHVTKHIYTTNPMTTTPDLEQAYETSGGVKPHPTRRVIKGKLNKTKAVADEL